MKASKHEQAVINLARCLVDVYFTVSRTLEWEDIDELYQAHLNLIAHRTLLQKRSSLIRRAVKKVMDEAQAVDMIEPFLNMYSNQSVEELESRIRSFIESDIAVTQFREYDIFIGLAKAYKFIPDECPASDLQYFDL